MNPRTALRNKITYVVLIVVLLLPLYWLSQPASPAVRGNPGSPGGKLSQLRQQYNLSQTNLGQLDPASETLRLATLGLRGVAVAALWQKANDYKMQKNWTSLAATLEQIGKMQPNSVSVWEHQGWNLAYNVSAEFDDYRDRYHWVMRGVDYLRQGIGYNQHDARLIWYVGWVIGQKIGRSDETKEYRRLFKEDDEFHGARPMSQRDNWLVAKEWYQKTIDAVDGGATLKKSPLLYRSDPAKAQINFAAQLEKEGVFGETAVLQWGIGFEEWKQFGDIELPSADGRKVRLNDRDDLEARIKEYRKELEALAGEGAREKLVAEKRAALTPEQRAALEVPKDKRDNKQTDLAFQAEALIQVTDDELARRVTGPKREEALKLAQQIADEQRTLNIVLSYRDILNYDYWLLRAKSEQDPDTVAAREWIYKGYRALAGADLLPAKEAYDKGLVLWKTVIERYPELATDELTREDLEELTNEYRELLGKLGMPFPENYPLSAVLATPLKKK
ncbi:MAG: hypothetical protein ACOY3P_26590 [Planctomycetota bacterium]